MVQIIPKVQGKEGAQTLFRSSVQFEHENGSAQLAPSIEWICAKIHHENYTRSRSSAVLDDNSTN